MRKPRKDRALEDHMIQRPNRDGLGTSSHFLARGSLPIQGGSASHRPHPAGMALVSWFVSPTSQCPCIRLVLGSERGEAGQSNRLSFISTSASEHQSGSQLRLCRQCVPFRGMWFLSPFRLGAPQWQEEICPDSGSVHSRCSK